MVYVIDGVAHPGHKPRGDEYKREPTKFSHDGPLPLDEKSDLILYISAACPWAHRTLITRNLSPTLTKKVKVAVVSPYRDDDHGWELLHEGTRQRIQSYPGGGFKVLPPTPDVSPLNAKRLLDVYLAASPNYTGNITTPTLYDAKANKIVSNDSFGIMRAFAQTVPKELAHLYDSHAYGAKAMDEQGRQIDDCLAKAVYMCGLARTQSAYESAVAKVFNELDRLEHMLASKEDKHHLVGDKLSLLDIQAIACMVRFDPVYFDLFKCYKRRLSSYPLLSAYARGVANEIGPERLALDLPHILEHYWTNFDSCNPNGAVPIGYHHDFLDGGRDRFKDKRKQKNDDDDDDHDDDDGDDGKQPASAKAAQNGVDQDQTNAAARRAKGEFVRGVSAHRNWLGDPGFEVEKGRYVLFVANNCPWCHRTMMARALYKGAEELVDACVMFYRRGGPEGRWQMLPGDEELKQFERERPQLLEGVATEDPTGNGFKFAPDIYKHSDPDSTEKSVPILFDRKTGKVVSNESADIVRMLAMATGSFNQDLLARIDQVNARVYADVNNGAYKAGFSSNQATYEKAAATYFEAFDWLDTMLATSKYLLTDDAPTEADLRLFPTVYRHDPVYHSRMKLNVAMVKDYPNLNRWLLLMKSHPSVQRASRIEHCVAGYFGRTGNGLVPFDGLWHDGLNPY